MSERIFVQLLMPAVTGTVVKVTHKRWFRKPVVSLYVCTKAYISPAWGLTTDFTEFSGRFGKLIHTDFGLHVRVCSAVREAMR